MPYKIGLVGLPNVGKSSLFSFLTKKDWDKIKNYPFATIKPNIGIMPLPDPRLEKLSQFWKSPSVPSVVEIIDIAGLVKGASEGLGLGNEFLSHIREVDLICQVLRCFPEKEITHVEKSVNPIRDFEIVQLELILADLQQVEKKLSKLKVRDDKSKKEKEFLQSIQNNLEKGTPINQLNFSEEEATILKPYNFLTNKPFFLLANYSSQVSETQVLEKYVQEKGLILFPLAVKLETEIDELSLSEKEEIGWKTPEFSLLAEKIKELLKLKNFFTVGEDETRSWLAKKSMKASECAGLIHSDFEKGFIKAEVYNYEDWKNNPNESQLRKEGKVKGEGSHYLVKEGDICYFVVRKI
ncbi:MAG: redox-regulated ATPase YchF [Candidatus Moeniiplasma glomeromycotorum]|nr:redox-regulated ATPase YchF [Candidatus Moeniiplasma glomeromycotorum]MCE8162161.1 redox-regulated ATPase YchF [Candidatus Moeniiplasma glomeromycotorum]MCE8166184.1 redox-regulated ATPase YchF [Candidatus Moeniiplasma glomeromycotorum]MCE8166560.1 redox-regulated ATPase YchF [Candidatus Moeniiplasma glomeromycotorum]